jgi:single-strand DNA-binding protein
MNTLNAVQLIGYVGKDPVVRQTQTGLKVASLRMATNETWINKEGEHHQRTEWHSVVFWGGAADIVEKYVRKGSRLYVRGSLRTRYYEADGTTKSITEVVVQGLSSEIMLLDPKPSENAKNTKAASRPASRETKPIEEIDDDIPF